MPQAARRCLADPPRAGTAQAPARRPRAAPYHARAMEPSGGGTHAPWLDARFDLTARGTTVRREILAGATTFVTMAYVLFVNPQILAAAAGPTASARS